MKKIGILACEKFMLRGCPGSDVCWKCFDYATNKKGKFEVYEEKNIQVVAMATCGGCPGVRVVKQGMMLAKQNIDAIHFSGCMLQDVKCPYFDVNEIAKEIENKTGIPVIVGIE
ncbi:CGGC domain-containing protein [Helicovermis profundi]|uniref:CGGC domain-containing protein n=1 Tax=Helicovermis profundi TaxID=3065157 RepID=A0AAU9E3U6_9FIRM|nr:CGGC domain-containing protein [Clostridia bacterium S502]